jgi:hypothetical protein
MTVFDKVIEASLEALAPQELAGAYKGLCGMLLVHTALAFRRKPTSRKDEAKQRNQAREWVSSGGGLVTFAECCEVMGMDEGRTRKAICCLAEEERIRPINRVVFGVPQNANLADADSGGAGCHRP